MSTLTIIITAATFFLIGAGIGHLFARKKDDGRAEAALLACYAGERENEPPIRLPKSRRRLSL